ncbi:single-stranded-DNA-specific exonuclease [Desulfobaculum xiamenense]|uniref:Single-stranded-DNA-specific exonuclease RecJ n=1 Tax=Desulfobaculum xiamenense TaxID=995050 RepID=A0A846QMV2_9BACT|nr:single-stranded-DNA-specific exonuclease RecJ [Desulfobaculum xiamenense]NJB69458.1 single-stranded-DNA-specific exonuclease [Desulfobaculum xiamenense]
MALSWIPRPNGSEAPDSMSEWAERLSVTPLVTRLLWQRGLHELQDMDIFLSPGLKHLAQLDEFPGLMEAAQVLADGLIAGRSFAVWGDYDVDGVTATALVTDFLTRRGYTARHHLPNRFNEGYGLNIEGIEELAAQGVDLLLTVDCGITSMNEVARARELGMTVVVSDHHLPGPELPPAHAVVDPRVGECPCPDLAGVGVAFLLVAALNRMLPGDPIDIRQFLDLVALGTIADVVKLKGQNRILVKNGLLLLGEARRPGIAALKEASGFAPTAALGAGQVGFGLAPRINAAGRMGEAENALNLLLAPDYETARPLAAKLDTLNTERRSTEDTILKEALAQAETQLSRLGLVLYSPGWHSGIIGIVASRVVEAHYRPTLIITTENGHLKGSGRSTREFDLHGGLEACSHLLLGFGGHRQAAGLSLAPENLEPLRDAFHAAVAAQCGDTPLTPSLYVDGELSFADIDFILLKELEMLQPFGPGNAEPVFASAPVRVRQRRIFGKNHVKLELVDEASGVSLNAKAWRQAENMPPSMQGQRIRIAFTPKIDRYQGSASIDLQIKDWKLA